MAGVKNLLELAEALDEVADLVDAAKSDDGKIGVGDLLRPAVWKEAGELTAAARAAFDGAEDMLEEVKDLDGGEASRVLAAYVAAASHLLKSLTK